MDRTNHTHTINGSSKATLKELKAKEYKRIFDRLRAKRRSRDWEVRIPHEFVTNWAHVLHPQSFLAFCVLQMFADWRPGDGYGHTKGHQTFADLRALTGLDKNTLRRALSELAFYGLISLPNGMVLGRTNRGTKLDVVVNSRKEPPKVGFRQQFKQLKVLVENVGAPTIGYSEYPNPSTLSTQTPPLSVPKPLHSEYPS